MVKQLMLILCLVLSLPCASALGEENDAGFTEDLGSLRLEIETLRAEIERQRSSSAARMELLTSRRTELELEAKRVVSQYEEQKKLLAKQKNAQASNTAKDGALIPALVGTCDSLRRYVASSLPFKREERLRELETVCLSMAGESSKASIALPKLWSFIEDEMRLTRENGLFKQVVSVDGAESLSDVARIGMTMMFFETTQGRAGYAKLKDGAWVFETLVDDAEVKQVRALFDSFRKGIKVGAFRLPARFAWMPMVRSKEGAVR